MEDRLDYIDNIKGFAMLLVVVGHLLQNCFEADVIHSMPDDESLFQAGFLIRVIYSFHMGLFFLVSGYLTYRSVRSFRRLVFKRTSRLMVPYIVFLPFYTYWFLFSLWEVSVLASLLFLLIQLIEKSVSESMGGGNRICRYYRLFFLVR